MLNLSLQRFSKKSKMQHIMKCPKCGKYTIWDKCSECNVSTINPKPAKFSADDKYAEYRRKAKKL